MRDLGSIQSPMNAFLLNIGLENPASADAQTLRKRPEGGRKYLGKTTKKVAWVNYPGLKSSKYYELARKIHAERHPAA